MCNEDRGEDEGDSVGRGVERTPEPCSNVVCSCLDAKLPPSYYATRQTWCMVLDLNANANETFLLTRAYSDGDRPIPGPSGLRREPAELDQGSEIEPESSGLRRRFSIQCKRRQTRTSPPATPHLILRFTLTPNSSMSTCQFSSVGPIPSVLIQTWTSSSSTRSTPQSTPPRLKTENWLPYPPSTTSAPPNPAPPLSHMGMT